MTQQILSDLERWQTEPVEWLDKELAWLMSDKKSAQCRISEDSGWVECQRRNSRSGGFGGYSV